jgi:hypothetical protein
VSHQDVDLGELESQKGHHKERARSPHETQEFGKHPRVFLRPQEISRACIGQQQNEELKEVAIDVEIAVLVSAVVCTEGVPPLESMNELITWAFTVKINIVKSNYRWNCISYASSNERVSSTRLVAFDVSPPLTFPLASAAAEWEQKEDCSDR